MQPLSQAACCASTPVQPAYPGSTKQQRHGRMRQWVSKHPAPIPEFLPLPLCESQATDVGIRRRLHTFRNDPAAGEEVLDGERVVASFMITRPRRPAIPQLPASPFEGRLQDLEEFDSPAAADAHPQSIANKDHLASRQAATKGSTQAPSSIDDSEAVTVEQAGGKRKDGRTLLRTPTRLPMRLPTPARAPTRLLPMRLHTLPLPVVARVRPRLRQRLIARVGASCWLTSPTHQHLP
ncbi:hypothetical protein V8C86DRAFT_2537290, partial [Haematococcus lacustris]